MKFETDFEEILEDMKESVDNRIDEVKDTKFVVGLNSSGSYIINSVRDFVSDVWKKLKEGKEAKEKTGEEIEKTRKCNRVRKGRRVYKLRLKAPFSCRNAFLPRWGGCVCL